MEAAHHAARLLCPEAIAHDAGAHPSCCPELRYLLEQVAPRRKEKAQPSREGVDVEPALARPLDVRDAVGERECQFLCRGRAGLAHLVAPARNGVPARQLLCAELEYVRNKPHRRLGWVDIRPARDVLLENV